MTKPKLSVRTGQLQLQFKLPFHALYKLVDDLVDNGEIVIDELVKSNFCMGRVHFHATRLHIRGSWMSPLPAMLESMSILGTQILGERLLLYLCQ